MRSGDNPKFEELEIEPAEDSPLDDWIRCIRNGDIPEENMNRALDLSRLNETAYLSAELRKPVKIASLKEA